MNVRTHQSLARGGEKCVITSIVITYELFMGQRPRFLISVCFTLFRLKLLTLRASRRGQLEDQRLEPNGKRQVGRDAQTHTHTHGKLHKFMRNKFREFVFGEDDAPRARAISLVLKQSLWY